MTIRSKVLAAALGLVMASGTIGGAFAQSGNVPAAATSKITTKLAPNTVATPKASMKKVASKHRRLHVAHRSLEHKVVAHRIPGHGKLARTFGRTHVVSQPIRAKIAKTHLVPTHAVKARFGKAHVAKAPIAKKHFVSHLVGPQKHAMAHASS